ncbi:MULTISPECIES: DUF742 domain-containing protein [Streptomyces]|uniref:DUF742 domain-containing protein n=1 Tax=Streptomyces TaxID=1883 RepID=UPI001C2F04C2|nr:MULTISPECIES: DUF742 domain-containing protein [Streptomyces]MBV1945237.1 DUF742 domain-containing protein [Streptomyces sp. BV129]BDH04683.1 hypothetical protein HEK131_19100 [Streptomyces seoulensis]
MTPRRKRRLPQEAPSPPPAAPEADDEGESGNPERLYAVTGLHEGGRARLDLVTLIVARSAPPPSGTPEQAAVLRLCSSPLSVAELSAYLDLPFSAMTALITELIGADLVQARAPIVRQALPDRSLLEAVMHGLQRL